MIEIPDVARIPNLPRHYRGVINLRGKIIPVIDLRLRLGMPNLFDEMNDMLTNREKDHINWLNELEKSVRDGTDFRLATDPHKCAFGKWYDTYKANNLMLDTMLSKFDKPHKSIHLIAEKVLLLEKEGKYAEAKTMIDSTRNSVLAEMIKVFSEFKECFAQEMHEIAIVLNLESGVFAITADSIESVGQLEESNITASNDLCVDFIERGLISGIGKDTKSNQLAMILSSEAII